MSYMALYRKWRPDEFEEVKGQEHVVTTLKNQIIHDRIGHAYLFCGTRGTGKTTVAKLFAKAVNCEHPREDGSPCNECPTCKAISAGNSLNVIEIDAASNNGVDNIREIKDEVQYSPTEGKYKVYIIDEVHMLSIGAFNALLKTLEEPPSYVIFILATTEAHKIPVTIMSRCQRYDFRRITIETIYERLADLLKREGIEAEEKAIRYVAKAADGSMRDALSLMDQCISFYLGEKLTYDNVLEVLGAVDVDVFNRLMDCISQQKTMPALEIVNEIVWQGRELSQFVTDFTWYMRNLLLIKTSDDMNDQLDISAENLLSMKEIATHTDMNFLMRSIRIFSEMSNQIRYATQKRITLELGVIKLTTPQMETDITSVLERIRVLEERLENASVVSADSLAVTKVREEEPKDLEDPLNRDELVKRELTKAQYEDLGAIIDCIRNMENDPDMKEAMGTGTLRMLKNASMNIGPDSESIVIVFKDSEYGDMDYQRCGSEDVVDRLKDLVAQKTGKAVNITAVLKDSVEEVDINSVNFAKVNFDIQVE